MKIISLDKVKKLVPDMEGAKNIFKQVPVSGNDGSPNFSIRVFTIDVNGHTPYHQHPFEHLNYIIEGHGALVLENGEEREVKKGICAVPKEYE
ncbi:MAG: cupin domain-containing protein [Deltaproteobacteria bacterium]|nr:cupin domain-containing protein [Deltaproteobacteria bacterium]